MKYSELIVSFAERIGIDGEVAFDEDGVWRIGTEEVVFAFREVPETDSLLVYSSPGLLPTARAEAFKTALLRANFMGRGVPGGAFSLDEEDRVWVHRFFDMKALDAEGLVDGFEDFATLVLEWRRLTEVDQIPAEDAKTEVKASDGNYSYFDVKGFIRV